MRAVGLLAISCAVAAMAGCVTASNSGVVPAEEGHYFIAVRTPGEQGGWQESQRVARKEAEAFCAKEGKKVVVVAEEAGPYAVDMKFRCEGK